MFFELGPLPQNAAPMVWHSVGRCPWQAYEPATFSTPPQVRTVPYRRNFPIVRSGRAYGGLTAVLAEPPSYFTSFVSARKIVESTYQRSALG